MGTTIIEDTGTGTPERWRSRAIALVVGILACATALAAFADPAATAPGSAARASQPGVPVGEPFSPAVEAGAPVRTDRPLRAATPARKAAARQPRVVGRRTVGMGPDVRSIPAKTVEGTAQQAQVRTVLTLRFNARKGDRRLIAAQVKAYQPDDTADELLMAATSLTCTPSAGRVRSSGATENLLRGRSSWLSSAFVYVAPRSGVVQCVVRAFGSRPRPAGADRSGYNRWYAWHGSRLYLGSLQPHWSASASKATRSRLIGRGQKTSTLSRFAPGSAGRSRLLLLSDHKLTTCSTARGSEDATTRGRNLCTGHVQKSGSRVRLVVQVLQGDGRRCTSRPVVDHVYRISAKVHHRTVRGLTVLAPPTSRCRGSLTVATTLQHVGGAPVMVHTSSGRTSIAQG